MLGRPRPRPVPPGGRRRSGRGASAPRLCVGRRGVGQGGGANRDERVERQPHQRVGALPVGTAGLVGRHKQHPHHVCGAPRKGRRARSQDPRHQLFPEVRRRDGVREPLGGGGGGGGPPGSAAATATAKSAYVCPSNRGWRSSRAAAAANTASCSGRADGKRHRPGCLADGRGKSGRGGAATAFVPAALPSSTPYHGAWAAVSAAVSAACGSAIDSSGGGSSSRSSDLASSCAGGGGSTPADSDGRSSDWGRAGWAGWASGWTTPPLLPTIAMAAASAAPSE